MIDELLLTAIEETIGVKREQIQVALRPPLEIQSNELYDVWAADRHLIAKRFLKPDELTTAPKREHQALQLLAAHDIAPQPVFYNPVIAPVVIYEYVEGEMWDRRKPTAEQLARLAHLWLTMHAVPSTDLWLSRGWERTAAEVLASFRQSFEQYTDWAAAHFPPGQMAIAQCLPLLEKVAPILEQITNETPLLCFCRADPRFANVIERPDGQLTYIDWEDSGLRDPARDLADLLTHPNQEDLLTIDEWHAFLQPYLAARTLVDPTVHERMHLYLAIFPLFWLATCFRIGIKLADMGQIHGWQINGLPANLRLQRYLARALTWPENEFAGELAQVNSLEFFPV